MKIVFDSGIIIECGIPQVTGWLTAKTKGREVVEFEEFYAIVSQTNFQLEKEDFLIAVLACYEVLNAHSAVLNKIDDPKLTEMEKEKSSFREAALDGFIRANQVNPDTLDNYVSLPCLLDIPEMLHGQQLLPGYKKGLWSLYQNNPLIPIVVIITKHAFHERTMAMTISPYTQAQLDEIEAFVIHNHRKIENLVSKIRALVSDLSQRPELEIMLDKVEHDIAPVGFKASSK